MARPRGGDMMGGSELANKPSDDCEVERRRSKDLQAEYAKTVPPLTRATERYFAALDAWKKDRSQANDKRCKSAFQEWQKADKDFNDAKSLRDRADNEWYDCTVTSLKRRQRSAQRGTADKVKSTAKRPTSHRGTSRPR